MTLFSGMVFLHVVSALGIFAALSLEVVVLYHLRRAASPREAGAALNLAPALSAIFGASALIALLTGVYLTLQTSAWPQPWLKIAMVALFLMAPFGAVSGRKMRAIRRLASSRDAGSSELLSKLQDGFLTFSLNCRIALVLGIVLLMTAKPELRESIGAVLAALVLGLASTVLFWRGAPPAGVRAPSGDSR
jgi:uncharacterized membrane protein